MEARTLPGFSDWKFITTIHGRYKVPVLRTHLLILFSLSHAWVQPVEAQKRQGVCTSQKQHRPLFHVYFIVASILMSSQPEVLGTPKLVLELISDVCHGPWGRAWCCAVEHLNTQWKENLTSPMG